jgi:ABC-2 type transport system ATP-binding protein
VALGIRTQQLTRTYRGQRGRPDVVALDAVSLGVDEGEVHGLLGPNGAGKTTLVKILCTILLPTSGTATVAEHDVVREAKAVRRTIGIVIGGERGLYWSLTGRQNLEYWAALYHVPADRTAQTAAALLERVGLLDRADDLVDTYSRGMKQRLHLARGLIGSPRVLFLDEPTTGMDPVAAHDFRALVSQLRSEGRTVLLTTHDMAEAEAVCDRVTLIDHGRVLAVETPASLSKLISQHERIDFEWEREELVAEIRALPGIASVARVEGFNRHRIELSEETAAPRVLDCLVKSGVTSIRTSRPSLEEVYLRLMRERRRDRW